MVDLVRQIASPAVLNYAWNLVSSDKSRWTRDLTIQEVENDLPLHIGRLAEELTQGCYRPQQMRCFEVAKASGGMRTVCAPAVRDKLVQRATLTVLEPLGETVFHPCSFGYRPLCTLDMALARLREWVRAGYSWLGDADIEQCFDSIPHRPLLEQLAGLCGDPRVVELVSQWLDAMPVHLRPKGPGVGLPQGLVLSPFLCNLYLHDMDMDLEEAGTPFVRYADDFILLENDQTAAQAALELAARSLERLGLRLNPDKTQVIRTSANYRFLGKRLPNVRPRIAG